MKRNFLMLTSALLILTCTVMASQVSEQDAQTVALNFFKSKANINGNSNATATLNYSKTESNGAVDFYVFDFSPLQGFVIISGDDNIEPVIAYSTESNFKNDVSQSVGVSDWMEQTSSRINTIVRLGLQADNNISGLWTAYRQGTVMGNNRATTVGPLLTTTWNQENDISTPPPYIYNLYCPYNSSEGERCVTGCVATAMAQIIKYWNWPVTGTGSYSYNATYNGGYGTLSFNFGATTFNWTNMPTVLTDATTTSQDASVDTLMYACGVSVAMEYGTDAQGGSGAYVLTSEVGTGQPCAQHSYGTYFGYNASAMSGVQKASYTAANWATLLTNELNAGRVIQYEGQDPGVGGHTWVCDGYESSTMFHMNWGWGGADNGYFSLSNLNPSPYTFNSSDAALIGIQPNSTTSCGTPTGSSTTAITTTGATFNWTAVSGASSYNVQYALQGSSTWTSANTTSTSYPVSGLASGTAYQWEVQTVCSSGSSLFTTATDFSTTTTVTCGTPTGLSTTAVTTTGATFNWTAVSGASSYKVQYALQGSSTWTSAATTSTSYPVSGLTSGTGYQWEVQTVCSSGSSPFTTATDFSTTATVTCGTVPSGLSAGTPGTSAATLTWGTVSGAISYNLQWKASSASTWTTITGLTSATYPLSGLSSCTSYEFEVATVCSSGSSSYSAATTFSTTGCTISYCASKGTSQTYEYISKVVLGTISNTSGNNAGYGNFTSESTNLAGGSANTITLTPGFTGSAYSEYFTVYIDYNQNGVFTDAGETVLKVHGSAAVSGSFTVPTTALNGTTRMRIQMQYGAYETNPCATYTYGEVEDYDVNITGDAHLLAPSDNSTAPTVKNLSDIKLYPNPTQNNVTVEFTADNDGKAIANVYNLLGQRVMNAETTVTEGSNTLNVITNDLARGVYIFELQNNGDVKRLKFIISK